MQLLQTIELGSAPLTAAHLRFCGASNLLIYRDQTRCIGLTRLSSGRFQVQFSVASFAVEAPSLTVIPDLRLLVTSGVGLPLELRKLENGNLIQCLGNLPRTNFGDATVGAETTSRVVSGRLAGFSELIAVGEDLIGHVSWTDLTEVYNLRKLDLVTSWPEAMTNFELHPESRLIACNLVGNGNMPIVFIDCEAFWPCRKRFDPYYEIYAQAFRPQGDLLAILAKEYPTAYLRVYSFPDFMLRFEIPHRIVHHQGGDCDYSPNRIVFSPDGNTIIFPTYDGNIWNVSVENGQILSSSKAHDGSVLSLDVLSESSLIASIGADGLLKIWEIDCDGGAASPIKGVTGRFLQSTSLMPKEYDWSSYEKVCLDV